MSHSSAGVLRREQDDLAVLLVTAAAARVVLDGVNCLGPEAQPDG